MKNHSHHGISFRVVTSFLAVVTLVLLSLPASAFVLDNFNSKTGWTDSLNGGSASVASGQFTIHTDNPNGSLTSSLKTASPTTATLGVSFTPVNGNTLELRVDANNVFNSTQDANALAVLALVPSGGAVLVDGYSLTVGANDVKIQKGAAVLYQTNGIGFAATNVTLVLRITPSGSSVQVNGRVYRQIPNGAAGQYATAIFDITATDASTTLVGVAGNVALGVKNVANPNGASVTFDNLQVFDIISSVLDDLTSLTKWTPFSQYTRPPDSVAINSPGQVEFIANPNANGGFAGMFYNAKSFVIQDGGRLEFTIDVVNNNGGLHSYSVLGFVPATGSTATSFLKALIEYHIAEDPGNTYNGKSYNGWWGHTTGAFPSGNFRLIITMTGEGLSVRTETRCEDLTKPVGDPSRVFYQNVALDTSGGTTTPDQFETAGGYPVPAPLKYNSYVSPIITAGSFAIDTFQDSVGTSDIIMSNAIVNQTIPPNLPPILNNLAPNIGANFIPSTSHVTFDLADEANVVSNSIVVTLNGVAYTNGSPGVTVTPAAGTAATRHVDLSGILSDNVFYSGTVVASDAQGASNVTAFSFDTFITNTTYVVECEEYNYNSGSFLDNPELISEGSVDSCCAYNGQVGTAEVDYHDNRGASGPGYDPDHTFRTDDAVYTSFCTDPRRAKYVNAGGAAGNFNEEEIEDIRDGDWMNYTHHYPSGTWKVYLRQSQYRTPVSLITLDQVTSDPTQQNQNTLPLGSFSGVPNGVGNFRDLPLSDASGNPIVLRMDGSQKTLRISQRVTGGGSGGILEQNYFILVPTSDPGTLRPVVSWASPTPGTAVASDGGNTSASPPTTATIANRDTTVNVGTIVFSLNGVPVPSAVVAGVSGGATVTWSITNLPPTAVITNTLTFQDSDGVPSTYTWTYSYPFVKASNAIATGTLSQRGWGYRMVQAADVGGAGNSLATAEQQLSQPPQIPFDVTFSTNGMQLLQWNDDTGTPNGVPGLDGTGHDNIATEALGFVHLTAGAHRFFVNSDDGWQFRSGKTPSDTAATVLGYRDGGTYNGTFDIIAEADGLYPARFVWYEHGGGAVLEVDSVNVSDGSHVLLNDPTNPSGVVEVYQPYNITLLSSATANGTYTPEAGGIVDQGAKTATAALSGARKFYRLSGPASLKITNVSKVGSNLVLTYQFQ